MIDITNKLLDIEIGKYCNTKAKQSIVLDSAFCPFGGTLPSGTRKKMILLISHCFRIWEHE